MRHELRVLMTKRMDTEDSVDMIALEALPYHKMPRMTKLRAGDVDSKLFLVNFGDNKKNS